jgi:hypothetical protein
MGGRMAHKRPGRHARRQRDEVDGLPLKFFVASNFVL